MKVRVDRNLCTGMAYCVDAAPTVFELDDKMKARVLDPVSVDDDTLLEAARGCPLDAIILEDDQGKQIYP